MNKISDLAKSFEAKSKEQASSIESNVSSEFVKHENAIKTALSESEKKISADIREHQLRLSQLILKGWMWGLLSTLLLFAAMWGILLYQGHQIAENLSTLREQQHSAELLDGKTWGVFLVESKGVRYVALPKGSTQQTGWTVGNGKEKRPAVKLD